MDDGRGDDLAYVAKLRHSNRPKELTAAVLLLLLAMRRQREVSRLALRVELNAPILVVALALGRYLTRSLGVAVPSTAIADDLLAAITQHAANAAQTLSGSALAARLGLVVQAETQRATAGAVRRAAPGLGSITRQTSGPTPCDVCMALAGTYYPPYPADLWQTHPRCACVWHAN